MAITTRAPHDFTNELATSSLMDGLSGGRVAWGSIASSVGSITNTEVDVVSFSVINPAGRYYKATVMVDITGTVANDLVNITLYEGSTFLNRSRGVIMVTGTSGRMTVPLDILFAAATGNVTYTLRCQREVGTGTITVQSCSLNVVDCGA
jgi:hypothetical protein